MFSWRKLTKKFLKLGKTMPKRNGTEKSLWQKNKSKTKTKPIAPCSDQSRRKSSHPRETGDFKHICDKNHVRKLANYFDFDIEGNEWEWQQQHGEKGNDVQKYSEDIPQHDQDAHVFDEAVHPVYAEDLQHWRRSSIQWRCSTAQWRLSTTQWRLSPIQWRPSTTWWRHSEDYQQHSDDVQQHHEESQQLNTYSHAQHKQYDSQQDQ